MRNLIPKEKEAELIYFLFFYPCLRQRNWMPGILRQKGRTRLLSVQSWVTALMQTATGQLISCAKPFQASGIRYPISAFLQCRRRSASIIMVHLNSSCQFIVPSYLNIFYVMVHLRSGSFRHR